MFSRRYVEEWLLNENNFNMYITKLLYQENLQMLQHWKGWLNEHYLQHLYMKITVILKRRRR